MWPIRQFQHGIFGIADQIHQDLQHWMSIQHDEGDLGILPNDLDMMAFQRGKVDG
jgi:hypothetical protein